MSNQCPKGLTPNRARTGLDKFDLDGLDRVLKQRNEVEQQGLIECAAGGKCPPDTTPEQADAIVEGSLDEPSEDESLDRARRCYIYGDCRQDLVSGDIKRTLPDFEQERLQSEKTKQIRREKLAFESEIKRCALTGQCKRPLTPENAKKFDELGALDQALQRCAAGFGCPEGINKSRADALTGTDFDRWKEQQNSTGKNDPGSTTKLTFDEQEIEPIDSEEPSATSKAPESEESSREPEGVSPPKLTLDDPGVSWPQRDKPEKEGVHRLSPIEAANPNIGAVAYVIAEAGPLQTPIFFSPQELLAKRLPNVDGVETHDFSIAQQDPSLEKPGEPVAVEADTIETIAVPFEAPNSFRIERANEHIDGSDFEKTRSTLTARINSKEAVPSVQLNAEMFIEQSSTERFGAQLITGGAPNVDVEAMAYIPIDDGGPAINVSLAIATTLPDRSISAGVVPYTEDPIASVFLITQTRTFLSANHDAQELQATKFAYGLAGLEQPNVGSFADFVDFAFPEAERGKPRGFLVYLSGYGDPQVESRTNTTRGVNKVTVIKSKGSQKGTIGVLVESVWSAER
ncbi:MAG: hypothetical protein AAGF25_08410 [Pseudomonadota bacterium]